MAKLPIEPDAYTDWMRALTTRKSRKRVPTWLELASFPPLHDGVGILPEPVVIGLVKLLAEGGTDDALVMSLRD